MDCREDRDGHQEGDPAGGFVPRAARRAGTQTSDAIPVTAIRNPLVTTAIGGASAITMLRRRNEPRAAHASSTATHVSDTAERRPLHASATCSVTAGSSRTLPSLNTGTPAALSVVSASAEAINWSGSVIALTSSSGSGIASSRKRSGAAMARTARWPARNQISAPATRTSDERVTNRSAATSPARNMTQPPASVTRAAAVAMG